MSTEEELEVRQRRFYINLNPHSHGEIPNSMGYTPSGDDVAAHEQKDSLQHWLRLAKSEGISDVLDCSWWMARLMDNNNRLSKQELDDRHSELVSFVGAVLYELINKDVIEWVDPPAIPKIVFDEMLSISEEEDMMFQDIRDSYKQSTKETEEDE